MQISLLKELSIPMLESALKYLSATIKSHHNVGGLPRFGYFELLETLRELSSDEVRQVGRELGIPDYMVID